jgi:hypothetical protein
MASRILSGVMGILRILPTAASWMALVRTPPMVTMPHSRLNPGIMIQSNYPISRFIENKKACWIFGKNPTGMGGVFCITPEIL